MILIFWITSILVEPISIHHHTNPIGAISRQHLPEKPDAKAEHPNGRVLLTLIWCDQGFVMPLRFVPKYLQQNYKAWGEGRTIGQSYQFLVAIADGRNNRKLPLQNLMRFRYIFFRLEKAWDLRRQTHLFLLFFPCKLWESRCNIKRDYQVLINSSLGKFPFPLHNKWNTDTCLVLVRALRNLAINNIT